MEVEKVGWFGRDPEWGNVILETYTLPYSHLVVCMQSIGKPLLADEALM